MTSPDIDYATVSNLAPSSSIRSNQATSPTTKPCKYARGPRPDGTDLNHTQRPGHAARHTRALRRRRPHAPRRTRRRTRHQRTQEFKVSVTDGDDQDTIIGAFNVRAFGGVDIDIAFNTRPGASAIDVGPSSFLHADNDALQLNVSVFDDRGGSWEWTVRGNGTECHVSRLAGDVSGNFTATRDTRATFTAVQFEQDSSCFLDMHVRDGVTPGLEYHLSVPVFVGTQAVNVAPHVVFAYSTSRKPAAGDTVTYLVRAADVDTAAPMTAQWYVSGANTGNITNTTATDVSSGTDVVYEFTMQMIGGGTAGTVHCTVTDAGGLTHNVTFDVEAAGVQYLLADPASNCPEGTEIVTDRNECVDAVAQLGHVWGESSPYAYEAQTDGNGFCIQCIFCDTQPISYMNRHDYTDYWLRRYCRPQTSRRRLAVDAAASGGPSPYVFGLDMRIEDGTLFLTSNEVPREKAPIVAATTHTTETTGQESTAPAQQMSSAAVAVCAAAGVALVVAGIVVKIRTKPQETVVDV